jgi:hypothetical protein
MNESLEEHSSKAQKRIIQTDDGMNYTMFTFICPGCKELGGSGLHMLPVNTSLKSPSWTWDGNLEAPTLNPSIMTNRGTDDQCHSFLEAGVFRFLKDSKYSMKGTRVEMPNLPDWLLEE